MLLSFILSIPKISFSSVLCDFNWSAWTVLNLISYPIIFSLSFFQYSIRLLSPIVILTSPSLCLLILPSECLSTLVLAKRFSRWWGLPSILPKVLFLCLLILLLPKSISFSRIFWWDFEVFFRISSSSNISSVKFWKSLILSPSIFLRDLSKRSSDLFKSLLSLYNFSISWSNLSCDLLKLSLDCDLTLEEEELKSFFVGTFLTLSLMSFNFLPGFFISSRFSPFISFFSSLLLFLESFEGTLMLFWDSLRKRSRS